MHDEPEHSGKDKGFNHWMNNHSGENEKDKADTKDEKWVKDHAEIHSAREGRFGFEHEEKRLGGESAEEKEHRY